MRVGAKVAGELDDEMMTEMPCCRPVELGFSAFITE